MRILVTGSSGFVGTNISQYLERRGFDILRLDVRTGDITGDIADPLFVKNEIKSLNFDAIIHLAAIANIGKTLEDPYRCYQVNSFGTLNMLELAHRKAVKRFIYASSSNVYGVPTELPVRETTPFTPRSPYDYSKAVADMLVQSYHEHRSLPTTTLRSWKLFGEHDTPTTAIPRFINACLHDQPLTLYNGGRDTTDPVYIQNYCHLVEQCLHDNHAVGEAFNVGSGKEMSIREIAEKIRMMIDSNSELQIFPPRSEAESKPMRSYPSIEKLEAVLRWRPSITVEEGLKRTIDFHRTHREHR